MRFGETCDIKKRIKHREDMFLRRLFGMLSKMAKADGKVDAWEVHAAEKAFCRFPRAAMRRKFCVRVFNEAKNGRIPLATMALDFANKWATGEDCLAVYEILWDIACAKGVLKPIHKEYLAILCRFLKLPESYFGIYYRRMRSQFREWTAQDEQREREEWQKTAAEKESARRKAQSRHSDYQKRMWDWFHGHFRDDARKQTQSPSRKISPLQAEYDLLGCAPDASDEIVRSAYRKMAKAYHPDLLRAKGLSEAQINEATAKMANINVAWEKIRSSRGM